MTYSILARDAETGEIGAAAVTGNLAVGAWVLVAEPGTGVVATQGLAVSTLWGREAISRLGRGESPVQIVDDLVAADAGAGHRQLTVLDSTGRTAGWTGVENEDVKRHELDDGLAIAGNWLANADVLYALRHAFLSSPGTLTQRLLAALEAATLAGGDARGMLSAAIKVVSVDAPPIDLRIDHSATPVQDLVSLHRLTTADDYRAFVSRLPTKTDPQKC